MKRSFTTLSIIAAFSLVLSAYRDGPAFNNVDRTGSPVAGGQFCSGCHSGGSFGVSIQGQLKDAGGNVVTSYTPGEDYTFVVQLGNTSGTPKFGFQAVALQSGNTNAGNFTPNSSNTQVTTLNNRKYGEQPAASTSNLFVLNWTAPAAGTGNVTFYAAGVACNGTNTTSGDQGIKMNALVINENLVQAVSENNIQQVSIYPNPSSDFLNITAENESIELYSIYDLTGKQVLQNSIFTSATQIDIRSLQPGTYVLRLNTTKGTYLTSRFIKL